MGSSKRREKAGARPSEAARRMGSKALVIRYAASAFATSPATFEEALEESESP